MPDDAKTEIRWNAPRDVLGVLDAVSMARGMNRTQLVAHIISEWAALRQREATLMQRISRRNPRDADGDPGDSGFSQLA